MSLKYKLDDVVVLGENVGRDCREYFTPGVLVRVGQLCCEDDGDDEHYTIYRLDGKGGAWWVQDSEINHEATEELQKSNESPYIVGKIEAVSDDNAKEVRTPVLEEKDGNGWFKRGELPPVGTECLLARNGDPISYDKRCVVLYVGTTYAIVDEGFGEQHYYLKNVGFRPIKSPEQIAVEEREEAIQKMVSCAGERMSFRSICESLYDAGLRFVGEDK